MEEFLSIFLMKIDKKEQEGWVGMFFLIFNSFDMFIIEIWVSFENPF